MCIGKRFAELEIKMTMLKLLRRFRVEWPSEEKVEPVQKFTNFPDKKLVFKFIDVKPSRTSRLLEQNDYKILDVLFRLYL